MLPHDCHGPPGRRPGRRLLVLAFGATFLARAVAGAVTEGLRAELWLTDQALGTLASAFAAAYAAAFPVGALLGAGRRRAGALAAGLALCGCATAAGAAAVGFWTLVLARTAAGAGAGLAAGLALGAVLEAREPAVANRGLSLAAAVGLALGYALGGACDRWPGWRGAFVASGLALLALAAAALRARQLPAAATSSWAALWVERPAPGRGGALALGGAALGASAAGAMTFWFPSFLERTRGVPWPVAGTQLAIAFLASALLGAALGRAALARPGAASWAAAAGTTAAAGGTFAALASGAPAVYLPGLMVGLLGLFVAARVCLPALFGAEAGGAPLARAALVLHGLGELSGAFGLGAVADRASFGRALYVVPAALLLASALWAAAAWARRPLDADPAGGQARAA